MMLPEEQRPTYRWMAYWLDQRDFLRLQNAVPSSVERAMKAPPISTLYPVIGKRRVKEFIEAYLITIVAQLNVSNTMTSYQIDFAADQLLEQFSSDSLADIVLACRRGVTGYYGNMYHQLDASVIIGWVRQLLEEKAMYLERNATVAKEDEKKSAVDYDAFRERLEAERKKEREEKITGIVKSSEEAQVRMEYKPPTAEQMVERELHDEYLGDKWRFEQDPKNRDTTGAKLINQFITEEQWRQEINPEEVLKQRRQRKASKRQR